MTLSQNLLFKLDRFAENFDPYEYKDQVDDVQAHIMKIKADLTAGNTDSYREFLDEAIAECGEETAVEVAKVLRSQIDKIESPKKRVCNRKIGGSDRKGISRHFFSQTQRSRTIRRLAVKIEKWNEVDGTPTPDAGMVAFLESTTDAYAVLQLRDDVEDNAQIMFANYSYLQKKKWSPRLTVTRWSIMALFLYLRMLINSWKICM